MKQIYEEETSAENKLDDYGISINSRSREISKNELQNIQTDIQFLELSLLLSANDS